MSSSSLRVSASPSGCQMISRAIKSFEEIDPRSLRASVMSSLFGELFSLKSFFVATRILIAMYSFVGSESPGLDLVFFDVDI